MYDYQPVDTRARWVYITFAILGILTFISIISTFAEIDLIHEIEDNPWKNWDDEAEANDNKQAIIASFGLLAFLGTVIAFLFWIHRAHRNLTALGARGLRFTPGWAVGWFFVPIMNLIRPYQVASEISRASDPNNTDATAWKNAKGSAFVGWWWAIYLLSNITGWVAARSLYRDDEISDYLFADYLSIFNSCIDILGIFITIFMVRVITRNQEQKLYSVSANPTFFTGRSKYCPNCGTQIIPSSKFCASCGHPISLEIGDIT